jgi:hypothetical protein
MSEREIVIRIRFPRNVRKHWLIAGSIGIVCFGALGYAAITQFTPSTTLTSTQLNANFNDLDSRVKKLEATQLGEQFIPATQVSISTSPAIIKPGSPTAGQNPIVLSIPQGRQGDVLTTASYHANVFGHQVQAASTGYDIVTCCLGSGGSTSCTTDIRDVTVPASAPTFLTGGGGPDLQGTPGVITHLFPVDTTSASGSTPFEVDLICYIRKQSSSGLTAAIVNPTVTAVFIPTN